MGSEIALVAGGGFAVTVGLERGVTDLDLELEVLVAKLGFGASQPLLPANW